MSKLKPYYDLVEAGYLQSQTSGDLVLFNYNDKCTYDKFWNETTLSARGIIFNKVTEEIVAKSFDKFFNLSELENKELPQPPQNESYEVYSKEDGSLGILYQDTDMSWKIATRGSFTSQQALKATDMFNCPANLEMNSPAERWSARPESKNFTLLFEIIYPENRVQPGARLVMDYGNLETLVLLGAINKNTGQDVSHSSLFLLGSILDLPVVKKFNYTIPELIELKKTLPKTEEGWVIRFKSGFRMKVKGDEYIKFHRLINSINPLSIWQRMVDENNFSISVEYKKTIPEEILPELNQIETALAKKAMQALIELGEDYNRAEKTSPEKEMTKKHLGMFCQETSNNVRHASAMFMFHNKNNEGVRKIILKSIRPNANIM